MLKCTITAIDVHNSFEFVHCWPDAPNEMYYLRSPHRHVFHVYTHIEVLHNDRELEFIQVKHAIDYFLHNTHFAQESSCEDIAHRIAEYLMQQYGDRTISVSVFEDDENGATVFYNNLVTCEDSCALPNIQYT